MRTRGYLRETPRQHSSAAPGGALADADSSCGGLWRTYARVGYAAPFNTAEHLLPPGACSALLATAGGGRAKPCPQPAPGRQASSATAARVPAALSQSSTRLCPHTITTRNNTTEICTGPGRGLDWAACDEADRISYTHRRQGVTSSSSTKRTRYKH